MSYLTPTPIGWDRVGYHERWTAHEGCGAVVTFVGVVRPDASGSQRVQALCYDAYVEMAERLIERLIAQANTQWSLQAVKVQHRLGVVETGQIGVVVVVAAQHRDIAYAASQFLADQIKHDVPIWKRELYDDGTSRWVSCAQEVLDVVEPFGAVHAHSTPSLDCARDERRESCFDKAQHDPEPVEGSNHAHV